VAETLVVSEPTRQQDDASSMQFWKAKDEAVTEAVRTRLQLVRVASNREKIKREWLREDPVLKDLPILKMANATNYELTEEQSSRLNSLWSKTGRDWNYSESIAGLWAYHKTYGSEISRLSGSPVAAVALLIGRAVSGVYNKVMNFRAIDPRDSRAGMSGGGAIDRQVWSEFFDSKLNVIRSDALEREFDRFWGKSSVMTSEVEVAAREQTIEEEADRLAPLGIDQLLDRYAAQGRRAAVKPNTRLATTRTFDRDPIVIAVAEVRANFQCEVPSCQHVSFISTDGNAYCEVHHIQPLSEGGSDTIDNVACICPCHHREAHHGVAASKIREALVAVRRNAGVADRSSQSTNTLS
jgi:predicted HNH restriction endonuclease